MKKLAINGGSRTVPEGNLTLWPIITDEDKKAVMECLDSGILTGPYGPQIRGAEIEFGKYIGMKHCLMVNSGTAALHIAVAGAGIGPGDEVIVPSFTFLATGLAVLHNNAVPVWVDVDPRTFTMDPAKIEAKINKRTRAIIPVHLQGLCADMDPILDIARRHNLIVIEDSAQAHGATYKGRKAGSMGDISAFSVQASKNLPCGESGFFLTNNDRIADIANQVRLFGQDASFDDERFIDLRWPIDRNRMFESVLVGWQYQPGEMPAALLRSQLRRLDKYNENARRNGDYLSESLSGIPGLTPPYIPENYVTVYHKYRLMLDAAAAGIDASPTDFRNRVVAAIKAEGVEAGMWESMPVPLQKNFKDHIGYGKNCPWSCPLRDTPAPKTDPADYAVSKAILDSSLVIGSHSYPIIGQKFELIKLYAAAIRKVFDNLKELF
jgi:perosamine synthetase